MLLLLLLLSIKEEDSWGWMTTLEQEEVSVMGGDDDVGVDDDDVKWLLKAASRMGRVKRFTVVSSDKNLIKKTKTTCHQRLLYKSQQQQQY